MRMLGVFIIWFFKLFLKYGQSSDLELAKTEPRLPAVTDDDLSRKQPVFQPTILLTLYKVNGQIERRQLGDSQFHIKDGGKVFHLVDGEWMHLDDVVGLSVIH